jgi:hypothetical protein
MNATGTIATAESSEDMDRSAWLLMPSVALRRISSIP